MNYFHVAALAVAPGSVIEPGNWGRVMRFNAAGTFVPHREAVYEAVRLAHFPARCSRLAALFVCPTEQSARRYQATSARAGVLYEVELLDIACPTHVGRIGDVYFPPPNYQATVADLETAARRYWEGALHSEPDVELLFGSGCRVLRRCA